MIIRPHQRSDADRIAEILADGWRDAYSGFMPTAFLAEKSDRALRRAEIAAWLDGFEPASEAIMVAADGDDLVGFIHMEHGDKGNLGATGMVNLLYVDRRAQGRGTGRKLMAEGARWLLKTWPGPLVLSAFALNPHRGFYATLGGAEVKRVTHLIAGTEIESALYFWSDPAVLLGAPLHHRPR